MRSILKQTSWLFVAQVIARAAGFFYTIYLANVLGVEGFGLFSVALSFFYLISTVSEFGFNRFLVKEVSLDEKKIPILLWNICIARILVTVLVFIFLAVILYLFDPQSERVNLILIAVLATLPFTLAQTLDGIYIALQKLQYSAISLIISSLGTAIIGIILLNVYLNPYAAVIALILGQIVYLGVFLFIIKKHGFVLVSKISLAKIKNYTLASLPFGVLATIGLISFKIDTLILSYMRGSFETGIYSASFRFFETTATIPAVLSIALFPILARLHDTDTKEMKKIFYNVTKIMLAISIIVVGFFIFILPTIFVWILPNYEKSLEPIKILALAIPFIFIHIPANQILLSTDKYLKPLFYIYILLMLINTLNYLILIRNFGYMGAAWGTVISEVMTFLVFWQFLKVKVLK